MSIVNEKIGKDLNMKIKQNERVTRLLFRATLFNTCQ